jgi:cell division FtsZ-interacting protein ZapD
MDIKKSIKEKGRRETLLECVALLGDVKERTEALNKLRNDLDKQRADLFNLIDDVFCDMKERDPEAYNRLEHLGGGSRRVIKLYTGGTLLLVMRDENYNRGSSCRISIRTEEVDII